MKRVLFIVALALTLCATGSVQAQEKQKVAVCVIGDISDTYKKIVGAKAVSRISQSKDYAAVERTSEFLSKLTQEEDFQLSGEVKESQIVKLGAKYGARYVAVFEVSEAGDDTYFISARLLNVESALIVKSADSSRKINSVEDLGALTNNVAYRLVTKGSK